LKQKAYLSTIFGDTLQYEKDTGRASVSVKIHDKYILLGHRTIDNRCTIQGIETG
jgi:hypothetical protein